MLLDDATSLDLDSVTPDTEVQHHLGRVLRVRNGERVSLTDGAGRWRLAEARFVGSAVTLVAISPVVVEQRADHFTLATAIPKGDRIDWLVQKAAELGVDRIVLIDAERSTVRWSDDRAAKQLVRLRRIADESTRQSRGVWRTDVVGPRPASEVLTGASLAEPGGTAPIAGTAVLAIGPEGGWTEEELALSPRRVDLGPNILRVETAAVVAAALRRPS